MRKVFSLYYEPRKDALLDAKRARVAYNKDGHASKRPSVFFVCNVCKDEFKQGDINVDHIVPVGATPEWPADDPKDWGEWMERLFCEVSNFQVICTFCHSQKTLKDREEMRNVSKLRRVGQGAAGDTD